MNEHKPVYNLKAVIRETGLTPATLRAWERRYGLFRPQRSSGGHRLFSEDEIYLLKWLVARQKEGLSISRAIALWRSQVDQSPAPTQIRPDTRLSLPPGESTLDQQRHSWREACLAFNEPEAEFALAKALAIATPEEVCLQVMQRGLAELGEGWYKGRVSVQQEHFASALVMRRLYALFAIAPLPTRPGRLLAACPPGEDHELALLMLAFIMRWRGWEVVYLGANIPLEQLDDTLQATAPDLVLSVSQTLWGAASLYNLANFLNEHSIPLAFGGGIFNQIPNLAQRIPGHFLGQQFDAAPQAIENLLAFRPQPPASQPLPPSYNKALVGFRANEAVIVNRVRQILHNSLIVPHHMEIANVNFTRSIVAALTLGDIYLLNFSNQWLKGLLENYGLATTSIVQYYRAFHQAVEEQPGFEAGPILEWLANFETIS